MAERLQKILAARGIASRRAAEVMIARGEVRVNGRQASLGMSADPAVDRIEVKGFILPAQPRLRYLALHKPPGYVTTLAATHGELTILDLLKIPPEVHPVGRLDKDTAGLLLLSSDGAWVNLVTHPRYQIEKEYRVLVQGRPSDSALQRMRTGVPLPEGEVSAPARVERMRMVGDATLLLVTVIEGKKRQIRHMGLAVGHPVLNLTRTRVGSIALGALAPGRSRDLTPSEVEHLRDQATHPTSGRGRAPRGADRD